MPIRRAAATPPQETPPKSNQDGDPDASSEESGSAGEEQEAESAPPTAPPKEGEEPVDGEGEEKEEPGETAEKPQEKTAEEGQGEKKGEKDSGKEKEKEKVKKVKRTIPSWATISASRRALAQKSSVSLFNQPKMDDILIEAIKACKHKASTYAIRKYIMKNYAALELDRRTFLLKKALKRLLEKGAIKQLKGKGFNGSFTIIKHPQKPSGKKPASAPQVKAETLGETLPLIMTHLCEPKEASYILIKKYMEQHFPQLNVEQRPDLLKSALQRSVDKGYLDQITGKGASGTFQIKRAAEKPLVKGGPLEEAILTAITAMNEPKTCSISIMRKFLLEKHKESRASLLMHNLKRTLKSCKMRGWMEQISGNGFNGTYQLCYPFYPSPAILFPEKHKPKEKEKPKRRKEESSEEEESEEEEEEDEEEDDEEEQSEEESESEDEPPSKKRKQQKRPPPKARRPPPTKKSWKGSQARSRGGAKKAKEPARSAAKGKKLAPAKKQSVTTKRSAPSAKKSAPPPKRAAPPAKKPVAPAKKPASAARASSSTKAAPPSKAPAAKKPAAAAKPKTPAAKKMTSRAPKRLTPKRPAPKPAAAPKSAVKAKPATRKSKKSRK
ncbi:hypothetical protein SKAU_G00425010 [Synaphobranchus kaupii]|uniref:Heterochromatin protein 1-binding protein 3 n=1 Tax=Synaphobranchus kaupii TaxID=118154 RepID=A0A9Q1E5P2_SYNKA|nr:hypothetical protein SKAU_G00425010 [Synaphobranchus kaupii]